MRMTPDAYRSPTRRAARSATRARRAAISVAPVAVIASRLDRLADGAQNLADLAAEEDQGDDGEDRDEGENECVFGEALAVLEPKDPNLCPALKPEQCDVHPAKGATGLIEHSASLLCDLRWGRASSGWIAQSLASSGRRWPPNGSPMTSKGGPPNGVL